MVHQLVSDTLGLVDAGNNTWCLDFRSWPQWTFLTYSVALRARTGWEHALLKMVQQSVQPAEETLKSKHSYLRLIGCLDVPRLVVQKCHHDRWKDLSQVYYEWAKYHPVKLKVVFSYGGFLSIRTRHSFLIEQSPSKSIWRGREKIGSQKLN